MKTRFILAVFAILLSHCLASSQERYSAQFFFGMPLSNSENSLRIMQDADYAGSYGATIGYERPLSEEYAIGFHASYLQSRASHVLSFAISSPDGPDPLGAAYVDATLREYLFDLSLRYRSSSRLAFFAGPSGGVVRRTIALEFLGLDESLSSRVLGAHAGLDVLFPLGDGGKVNVVGGLEFRYLHAIGFDENGRSLEGYAQNFLDGSVTLGLAYQL